MLRFAVGSLLLAASVSVAAEAVPKEISLGKLHQKYVKAGYSSMDLPEFEKRVAFSGVAISEPTKGFRRGPASAGGGALLKAGVAGSENELARLVARDAAHEAKMEALKAGSEFKAVCTVAFASGTGYIPLQDCVFR